MKRRKREVVRADGLDIPECLMAGACLEVWAPDATNYDRGLDRALVAFRAYQDAVRLWRQRHGIGPWEHSRMPAELRSTTHPWSFDFLAQRDPEHLERLLRSRQLPADWQPTVAPPEWRQKPAPGDTYAEARSAGRVG